MMLFGMINWTYTWYRPDGPLKPEQLADLAADLFLGGLCQSTGREAAKPRALA
jgi:TetR/AcrR family transcriptional regulator